MCGIIGIILADKNNYVNQYLVDALTVLQHRGQDAAGIVTLENGRLNLRKDTGSVSEVFDQQNIVRLVGNLGIGHTRYPTAGGSCSAEAQPLYTNSPFGIAICHNGNLTNTSDLVKILDQERRHINTDSDSEILLNVFAEELQRRRIRDSSPDEIFDAVRGTMRRCKGSFSVVMIINGIGLLAFRDPFGLRPLCFGSRKSPSKTVEGTDYCWASESVALDTLNPRFTLLRDVAPGEAMLVTLDGQLRTHICHSSPVLRPCIFEFVYFARPDSILDGVPVYEARLNMGEKLALRILSWPEKHDIDVVIPIPDTARTSALQCAYKLDVPYREGFIKNRYIARTFIMPGQEVRRKSVKLKLNTISSEFSGRNVLLVDDSIVRGTTSMELVIMAREAGAKKVYFASAAPPVRYPNVYGIDIPTSAELIAYNRTEDEVATSIGADKVIYNVLEDLEDAVRSLNPEVLSVFDSSCFNGIYVTSEVTPAYLAALEERRGDGRVGARSKPATGVTDDEQQDSIFKSPSPRHSSEMNITSNGNGLSYSDSASKNKSRGCETLHNGSGDSSAKKQRT